MLLRIHNFKNQILTSERIMMKDPEINRVSIQIGQLPEREYVFDIPNMIHPLYTFDNTI